MYFEREVIWECGRKGNNQQYIFHNSHFDTSHSSAPVPLLVIFVGGLDAESGRPQPSKLKVCDFVGFDVGGWGRVRYGSTPN